MNTEKDLKIDREKRRSFCGTVKIRLCDLQHKQSSKRTNQIVDENIRRLLSAFETEGCLRSAAENHVPALTSRSVLPEGILSDDQPRFYYPSQPVVYLHGRHRLEAARRFFRSEEDRWWPVDLYAIGKWAILHSGGQVLNDPDLSPDVVELFQDQLTANPSINDGEIVRQIRLSTLEDDKTRRSRWLNMLSKSKRDLVLRLEGHSENLMSSLDALIPFAGLWPALHIGTFPRLLNLHCPEELSRYLRSIELSWEQIMHGAQTDQLQLDVDTVQTIQGRCAFRSLDDRRCLQNAMDKREVFPAVEASEDRTCIFNNICSIRHVIPSLHTFLEDTKYLEPCAKILRELLPARSKNSLSQCFTTLHDGRSTLKIQKSEFCFEDRELNPEGSSQQAYRQLWLFTLRHFHVMSKKTLRTGNKKQEVAPPVECESQLRWWHALSSLARESGYQRVHKFYFDRRAADAQAIESCIRNILPSKYYDLDSDFLRRIVLVNCQLIEGVQSAKPSVTPPSLTSDQDDCVAIVAQRLGRPTQATFENDEAFLFLDNIYSTHYDDAPKRFITSFSAKRDMIRAFLGTESIG